MSQKKRRPIVCAPTLWASDVNNVRRLARYLGVHASQWMPHQMLISATLGALAASSIER